MPILRVSILIFLMETLMLGAAAIAGQDFPNRPMRIVTTGAGGDGDFMSRVLAQALTDSWGQQVVVENRPAGVIPGQIVSKAPPDGYTLLCIASAFWISPFLQNTPYDPIKDFTPVTLLATGPNVVVLHPSVQANSIKELIALAKARPGELNYAMGAIGSSAHLATELFKGMAGVNIVRVSYKTGSLRMTALLSGEVQMELGSPGSVAPHVKTGKLKALAVTSAQPSALAPGLPTVAASGLPGYESESINGMFVPAHAPGAVVDRLNRELVRVLYQPDVRQKFFEAGAETVGSSPQAFAIRIKSEVIKWGKVIKDAGIRAE